MLLNWQSPQNLHSPPVKLDRLLPPSRDGGMMKGKVPGCAAHLWPHYSLVLTCDLYVDTDVQSICIYTWY